MSTARHWRSCWSTWTAHNSLRMIFFLAFLPQFVAAQHGRIALQIVLLGLLFIVATLVVFGAIAWFSGLFGTLLLRSALAQRWLNRFAGIVFVGLAVRLATSQR